MTIIFGWERELGGDGEEGRDGWGGGQGQVGSKPTRHCLVEQGPLGTDRGPLETEERQAGNGGRVGGNEGKDRWRRPASTISCPLKTHDKRGA